MSLIGILIVVFVVVAALLFVGGFIASGRRQRARSTQLVARIEAADQALAQARAGDRGWDLEALHAAAREAFASRFDGRQPEQLHLVQVIDRPGTEQDEAVLRAVHGHHEEDIVLGRQGDRWVAR